MVCWVVGDCQQIVAVSVYSSASEVRGLLPHWEALGEALETEPLPRLDRENSQRATIYVALEEAVIWSNVN